jgi:hypothetical protein
MVHVCNAHNLEDIAVTNRFVEGVLIREFDERDFGLCRTEKAHKKSIESPAK